MKPLHLSQIMSKPVITAKKTDTIAHAAILMKNHRVGMIIVVENQKPIGVISERDIINKVVAQKKSLALKILAVMTKTPITGDVSMTDVEAAALMSKKKIKKLPLLKNGRLVGVVTQTDLLKALSEKWML